MTNQQLAHFPFDVSSFRRAASCLLCALLLAACGGDVDTGVPRELAEARAQRFDYDAECGSYEALLLGDSTTDQGHDVAILQRRTEPTAAELCFELPSDEVGACLAAHDDCLDDAALDWDNLDWSQWHSGATVVEIGVAPEGINPARSQYGAFPEGMPGITRTSFYDLAGSRSQPPGCPRAADCGFHWYLDATEAGVALVLCPRIAAEERDYLESRELRLCVVE